MKKYKAFDYILLVFLLLVSVICVLPFANLLAVSLSGSNDVAAGKVTFFPVNFTLESYKFVVQEKHFWRALLISVERVILGTSINLILMVLTAYPLSKEKEKFIGRQFYVVFFMITMLFSGGMIPGYLLMSKLHLKNTMWALVLPGALPVSSMIILMNFIRGLPVEIDEAAQIDGASPLKVLLYVDLPVLKPALATVGLFCMVGHWNEWFSGKIYMNHPDKYPLQTYLHDMLLSFDELLKKFPGVDIEKLLSVVNARTARAAQLFVAALPIMLVYPFLQKYFTKGLVIGSVKG